MINNRLYGRDGLPRCARKRHIIPLPPRAIPTL